MSAYVVVYSTLKNADKMAEYAAAAAPMLQSFGGKMLARGPSAVLAGKHAHANMAVIEFPGRAQAQAWYDSPGYQALIPTRETAMDSVFILGGE